MFINVNKNVLLQGKIEFIIMLKNDKNNTQLPTLYL